MIDRDVTVISGGVGAARFLRGLQLVVPPARIAAVVNTGDDTVLHGLSISPDLDTITYTLAGAIDPERGWGLAGETWQAMEALARYEPVRPPGSTAATTWFNLGDRDLATHLYRTARRAEGAHADGDRRRDAPGLGPRRPAAADDRRRAGHDRRAGHRRGGLVPGLLRAPAPRRPGARRPLRRRGGADRRRRSPRWRRPTTIVIAPSNPLVSIGPVRALPGVDELLGRAPTARRRRVADRRRRGAEGSGRPDARRARPRAVRRRRRPAVRARSPPRSSSTPSTPTWPRQVEAAGDAGRRRAVGDVDARGRRRARPGHARRRRG